MGQIKGNPAADRSYQNQAYMNLWPDDPDGREEYNDVTNVQLDKDITLSEYIQQHLKGNYPISSSYLIVNGTIRAEEYIVNTFSSSVIYTSGSSRFGDTISDYHTFTGSMYITGSTIQFGNINQIGNSVLTGSLSISGSTTQIGNNTLIGNTILSGSVSVSGALDVQGSTNFHNHLIIMTGSVYTTGSQQITGSLDINGNLNVASGSEFYLAGNKLFNYGDFFDTTTQSGSANTAYPMKLSNINYAHNVSITNGSRITVANTGIYNIQFSAQLTNTANTNIAFDIWLAYTGSNVDNTNTQIDVNKSAGQLGRAVASWNFLKEIKANDYVEILWSCSAATGQVAAFPTASNPSRPAVPSVIATITQIA